MSEELYRNKLHIDSPTSISLGHITWFGLDTKMVGRIKALLEENKDLKSSNIYLSETCDKYKMEVERLNNIIEKLEQENEVLKTQVVNKDKYSYGIRMGSDKECQ